MIRQHRHVVVRARISDPPKCSTSLELWIKKVVESVGMKVVAGPTTYFSSMEGNKGYTSIAVLDFSHIAIHCWDEDNPALLEFDLFSCKEFDVQTVVSLIHQEFNLLSYDKMEIDRDELEYETQFLKVAASS